MKTFYRCLAIITISALLAITGNTYKTLKAFNAQYDVPVNENMQKSVTVNNKQYCVYQIGLSNDKELYSQVENSFHYIPEKLLNQFYADGCTFKMESDKYFPADENVVGFTRFDAFTGKCESINIRSSAEATLKPITICHEFGHYLDYKMGYVTESKEWKEICEKEFPSCRENHQTYFSAPDEFFAQEFAYYCFLETSTVSRHEQRACPEAFAFIDNVVNEFNNL